MNGAQIRNGGKSMEQNSPVEILESQIRECFGRVVWTHKTQEKCADIIFARNSAFKWTQIILSAITTTGILASLFIDGKWVKICSAIISFALVCINSYLKQYNLDEIAKRHADAAVDIWDIRESYFSLLTDLRLDPNVDIDEIKKRRDELQNRLKEVYKCSPRTISKAYTTATKALKECEEMTFSDEEIDKFLPKKLHKTYLSDPCLGVDTKSSTQPFVETK